MQNNNAEPIMDQDGAIDSVKFDDMIDELDPKKNKERENIENESSKSESLKNIEDFIASILVLYDNIVESTRDPKKSINILSTVSEKQYLAYYVYRIWIKYRKLIEDIVTRTKYAKILEILNIPAKYQEIYITYPMANKMPSNEQQLDLILYMMLDQLNMVANTYQNQDTNMPKYVEFKKLGDFLDNKSMESIIQDILQIKMLIPNLSAPSEDFLSWDTFLPFTDMLNSIKKSLE